MQTLAQYPNDWSVVSEQDKTFIAVAYGPDQYLAPNLVWDLGAEEDDDTRDVQFAELLELLIEGRIVDTDYLSGIAFHIGGVYDWTGEGPARGLYRLKATPDKVFVERSTDVDTLVGLMQDYTESEPDVEGS